TPSDTEVPYLNYQFTENDGIIDAVATNSAGLSLAMSPFEDSYPVFSILASDSMTYISSDPYYLSAVPYDGHTAGLSLLGFYDKPLELSVQLDTICSGSSYLFPDGTEMTEIEGSLSYFSVFNTVDLQSDSIVVSNLFVVEPDTTVLLEVGMFIAQSSSTEYQWLDCTADFAQIEGDTFMAFVPLQSGSYAVEITDGACVDTSSCYTFVPTAMEEIHSAEAPQVFPNPNTGSFTLSFATAQDQFQFKIYSATGKLLAQGTELYVKEKEFELRLTPGLYFLEIIRSDERDVRLRLIIE
ncbi:MAG: T9SS type A sorting domain-containing protein, partial [Saprospiraceae bacterium]|nr:T9SS type A sorting domain-containing protein [Saprospiraceae bacterium]MDG1296629.1 T9SS type A sorting domain-containing protein [Saprospiraceae bacterium]